MAFNKIKVYNKLVVNGKVTNDNDLTKSKIYITGGFHRSSKDLDETSRTELANLYRKWVLQENDIPVGDSPLDDIIGMSTADVRRKVKKAMFGDADQILGWGAWKQHDGTTKNTEALLMDYLHRNDFEYEILN